MRKLVLSIGVAGLLAGAAMAHPINTPYETRGKCEAAYAHSSKGDRERLVASGVFDSYGEAQEFFREVFTCEYDEDEEAWFIVFNPQ